MGALFLFVLLPAAIVQCVVRECEYRSSTLLHHLLAAKRTRRPVASLRLRGGGDVLEPDGNWAAGATSQRHLGHAPYDRDAGARVQHLPVSGGSA